MSDAQPITGCRPGDSAEHVFLCGDPGRVDRIAESWGAKRTVCETREYRIVTGELDGVPLSVASTGIGAPSTAIVPAGESVWLKSRRDRPDGVEASAGGLAVSPRAGGFVVTARAPG